MLRIAFHSQRLGPVLQRMEAAPLPLGLHLLRHEREWQRLELRPLPIAADLLPICCESRILEPILLRLGSELQRLDPESQRLDLGRG